MPRTYNYVPLTSTDTASLAAYAAAVVRATPAGVSFGGLELALPFGKRGSMAVRATAKTYGARWDGTRWTVPNVASAPGVGADNALMWFFAEGLAARIITYTYAPWVWDGHTTHDLMLDVPFTDKHRARAGGARWHAGRRAWYVPAAALKQSVVDWANGNGWAQGYWNPVTNSVDTAAPAPAPHTPSAVVSAGGPDRPVHEIAALYGIAAVAASRIPQPGSRDAYAVALRTGGTSVYWLTRTCPTVGGVCVIGWAPVPASHVPGLLPAPDSTRVPATVYCMMVRHGLSPSPDLRAECRTGSSLGEWARQCTSLCCLTADAAATAYEALAREHGFVRPTGE